MGHKAGPSPKTTPLWVHTMQRTGPHALATYRIISCPLYHLAGGCGTLLAWSVFPCPRESSAPSLHYVILQSHYIRIHILLRDNSLGNPIVFKIQECICLQPVPFEGSTWRPYSPSADAVTGIYLEG